MSKFSVQNLPAHNLVRYVVGVCLALLVFVILWALVTQLPAVSRWDSSISQRVQQLRGPALDPIMVMVTLLGDTVFATLIVALVVIGLLSVRRWWLSLCLVCAGLSAMLIVSVLKSAIGRARPELVDSSLHSLSFPSGHACTAALVIGLLAVLLADRKESFTRYALYAVATLMASLVAFSRVYLLAHWPTDVFAGLALGYALTLTFAWQLHTGRALSYRYRRPLIAASALIILGYAALNYSTQASRYGLG